MKKIIFMLAFCAAGIVAGQTKQESIKFNVVYDCPAFNDSKGVSSGRKFKVLRCDGEDCKVFQINEYNPNGGFETQMTKAHVKEDISRYRCVAPGGNNQAPQNEKVEDNKETPKKEETPEDKNDGKVSCPVSDPDSNGKTAMEKSYRGAIRESWEKEAEPGLDGAVTVTFQAFSVGAAHKYRVYVDPDDAIGKMIHAVRATFTTCTDYNRRIEKVKREREFSCYKNTAGKNVCTIIAAPNTNVKDKTESIDKPFK
jgi:hypothetical protein